jgi:predicted alpha/beta hydrolase family esterase
MENAQRWAQRWGSHFVNLGDAGHVNRASGHGPLPIALQWVSKATETLVTSELLHRA